MAEFINNSRQQAQRASDDLTADGMNAFGRPVPYYRQQAAMEHCKQMGMTDTEKITGLVGRAAEAVARDKPYEAMEAIMAYLDITGAYRILAVLCTHPAPHGVNEPEPNPPKRGPTDVDPDPQPYSDLA
jgi:hypothetical protein